VAKLDYKLQSRASEKQKEARKELISLFRNTPLPIEHLLVNLGLYMRSSVVAKFLYVNELYERIIKIPGIIMEFGVWWGQNMALFESLRAAYEPYNFTRKVVGFDTFKGYPSISKKDGKCDLVALKQYDVSGNYVDHLGKVLDYHQRENVMSHIKKFEIVEGDAIKTTVQYLKKHPETIISLAYFDMQLYEPTQMCLEMIKPYLVRGSVVAMDELNCPEFPGETIAFREVFGSTGYRLYRSRFLPDRSYAIVE